MARVSVKALHSRYARSGERSVSQCRMHVCDVRPQRRQTDHPKSEGGGRVYSTIEATPRTPCLRPVRYASPWTWSIHAPAEMRLKRNSLQCHMDTHVSWCA